VRAHLLGGHDSGWCGGRLAAAVPHLHPGQLCSAGFSSIHFRAMHLSTPLVLNNFMPPSTINLYNSSNSQMGMYGYKITS